MEISVKPDLCLLLERVGWQPTGASKYLNNWTGMEMECQGWLDYFLMGDVHAVGFGFDLSEFDIWWAIERKSRE